MNFTKHLSSILVMQRKGEGIKKVRDKTAGQCCEDGCRNTRASKDDWRCEPCSRRYYGTWLYRETSLNLKS